MKHSEAGIIRVSAVGIAALAGVLVLGVTLVSVFAYMRAKRPSHERETDEGSVVSSVPSQDRALAVLPPAPPAGTDGPAAPGSLSALPTTLPTLPAGPIGSLPAAPAVPERRPVIQHAPPARAPEAKAPPIPPHTASALSENCTLHLLAGDDAMPPSMAADDVRLAEISARVSCRHAVKDAVLEWLVDGGQTDVRSLSVPQAGQVQSAYGNRRPSPGLYVARLRTGTEHVDSSFTVAVAARAAAKDR